MFVFRIGYTPTSKLRKLLFRATASGSLVKYQVLQFIEESLDILEVAIDRCEAHIGDLVQIAEPLHDQFSYLRSRYLSISAVRELSLDRIYYFGEFSHWDRSLLTCFEEPAEYFLAVELFPTAVLLDDHIRDFIAPFIRRETALAAQALAAAANNFALLTLSGVDDAILLEAAERTGHKGTS
jgi:hypothetical protein